MRLIDHPDGLPRGPVAFVPTMGALHAGHLALIRQAAATGHPVVVSVFVNPTQFDSREDLNRYPRTLDDDLAAAASAGATHVFAPAPEVVYPPDKVVDVPPLPPVATSRGLEDAHRPGHFAGVAQVVARLFDLVQPTVAVFGEKDYQQLLVVRAMVAMDPARWPSLEITAAVTVREPDGLARSSRNRFLDAGDRAKAHGLARALVAAGTADSPRAAEAIMADVLAAHALDVEYAVVRDARDLAHLDTYDAPARGLIAARVGDVRLIDNAPMPGVSPLPDVEA